MKNNIEENINDTLKVIEENINNTLKALYDEYYEKKRHIKICAGNNDFISINKLIEEIIIIEAKINLLEDILEL